MIQIQCFQLALVVGYWTLILYHSKYFSILVHNCFITVVLGTELGQVFYVLLVKWLLAEKTKDRMQVEQGEKLNVP